MRYKPKDSGFTLIELMIITAILGILLAVFTPDFLRWIPNFRLKKAASELYDNLHLAKLKAIRYNKNYKITYYTNPDRYTISTGAQTIKTVILNDYGSGIKFDAPDNNKNINNKSITFNSRGTSNMNHAYLSSAGNAAYYKVGPLLSGVIRYMKWNGNNWE